MPGRSIQKCKAVFSKCGKHRYWLRRQWDRLKPIGVFLCLNPSKADALTLDPTTMNCTNLAAHWDWGGFILVNLYSHVSTPVLPSPPASPPLNTRAIRRAVQKGGKAVVATGNEGVSEIAVLVSRGVLSAKAHAIGPRLKGGGFPHPRILPPNVTPNGPLAVELRTSARGSVSLSIPAPRKPEEGL